MSRTQIPNRLPIAICLDGHYPVNPDTSGILWDPQSLRNTSWMGELSSFPNYHVFYESEYFLCPSPQSLRESLGRALSFYRASSIIVSQPDTDYQLERGFISPKFGISDAFISFSGSLSEKPDKRATLHVVVVPPPVREDKQIQRIQRKPSRWIRFGLWFNTYR
jgi:hypothetical protein